MHWENLPAEIVSSRPIDAEVFAPRSTGPVSIGLELLDAEGTVWNARASAPVGHDERLRIPEIRTAGVPGWFGLQAALAPDVDDPQEYLRQTRGRFGRPFWGDSRALKCRLTAKGESGQFASVDSLMRQFPKEVSRTKLAEGGLRGVLYTPKRARSVAIICMSGSGGGVDMVFAPALAGAGFVALSLALFGFDGRPPHHQRIALDYVADAARWLAAESRTRTVAILGTSRGAEAALLVALHFPAVTRLVFGVAPGSVVTPGWSPELQNAGPAWTVRGRSLPYSAGRLNELIPPLESRSEGLLTQTVSTAPFYEEIFRDTAMDSAARINLADLAVPVYAFAGLDDALWPSALACRQLAAMAPAGRFLYKIFEHAGHLLAPPGWPTSLSNRVFHPVENRFFATGGTQRGNALAAQAMWYEILKVLEGLSRRD